MTAIVSLLILLILSLVVTRFGAIALTFTGLSRESARFQARSAYTGVGFTTGEAEQVVRHPVRRRIVMLLMLLGSVGAVTVISSVIVSAIDLTSPGSTVAPLVVLVLGLAGLVAFAQSRWVDRRLAALIAWALRRYTSIDVRDYANLLHLSGEYGVVELGVERDDWLTAAPLGELDLCLEGVLVLGVQRGDGRWVGAPPPELCLQPGDVVTLYGRTGRLAKIDVRGCDAAGKQCRAEGIAEQEQAVAAERARAGADPPVAPAPPALGAG